MKKKRRWMPLLISLCLLVSFLQLDVAAAGKVDMNQAVSLTITASCNELKIAGMKFDAYLVSTMDDCGELTPTKTFEAYASELDIRGKNDVAWETMAQTLERAIILDGTIKPKMSVTTDKQGTATFSNLEKGLYLISAASIKQDGYVYNSLPFFAVLPEQNLETNTWNYQVQAIAKVGQNPVVDDYKVVKIWKDECHKADRPDTISIQLMCDGEAYGDPITLPQDGRWEYTWKELDVNHKWTVTEAKVDGYQEGTVEADGTTFTVTNVCDKDDSDSPSSSKPSSKLPQTGQLWWPVPILFALGLLCLIIGVVRRRGTHHEA